MSERLVNALRRRVRGALLEPGHGSYDTARKVWNARIDRRPAGILRCAGVADVIEGVKFAREKGVELAIRGTGHNVTGSAVCDGGLVLDLSPLDGVRVQPDRLVVSAQAGVTWGKLDEQTQRFGLATTGGRVSTLGIAGVTLGGGYGWAMRAFGLTVDNLESVDIVTADHRFLTASARENPDLFWAVRGGGGNFGVATAFRYRLHRIPPQVTGGAIFYPAHRGREVLEVFGALMASAPDELGAQCNLLLLPPAPFVPPELHKTPVVAIALCHLGPPEQARRDLTTVQEQLGPPLLERIGSMPYLAQQRLFDAAGRFGAFVHGRSGHLVDLDAATDVLVRHSKDIPSPMSIVMISCLGGAVARVDASATAFAHRDVPYSYAINAVWTDPHQSERAIAWADDFGAAMRPHSRGVYVNELGDEGQGRIREAYGNETYDRLVEVKRRYDPTNLFHLNQNIDPYDVVTTGDASQALATSAHRRRAVAGEGQLGD